MQYSVGICLPIWHEFYRDWAIGNQRRAASSFTNTSQFQIAAAMLVTDLASFIQLWFFPFVIYYCTFHLQLPSALSADFPLCFISLKLSFSQTHAIYPNSRYFKYILSRFSFKLILKLRAGILSLLSINLKWSTDWLDLLRFCVFFLLKQKLNRYA